MSKIGRRKLDKEAAKAIGTEIKRHRQFLLITQEELGSMANISLKMMSQFERGESLPNAIQIVQIAKSCQTTVEKLCQFVLK